MTGEALYTDDVPLPPNTLHAALVKSIRPHAKINSVDYSAALQVRLSCTDTGSQRHSCFDAELSGTDAFLEIKRGTLLAHPAHMFHGWRPFRPGLSCALAMQDVLIMESSDGSACIGLD